MSNTWRDITTSALRLVGVVSQGQEPTGDQSVEALMVLQELIDSYNGSDIMLYKTAGVACTIDGSKSSYSIGTTGDIQVPSRPTQIDNAYIETTAGYDQQLTQITPNEWGEISNKNTGGIPTCIMYSAGYPNATITLYPVPNIAAKLTLQYLEPLNSSVQLDEIADLPPAYRAAIRYGLAISLYAEYGLEPSPTVTEMYKTNMKRIQSNNVGQPEKLRDDFQQSGRYNVYTDRYQ